MNDRPATEIGVDSAMVDQSLAEAEALNGVPNYMDIPDELREVIETATLNIERMFWLRAAHIVKDVATAALLRRAIYAEQRCWEMENRAAEIGLIAAGLKEEVERLKDEITVISGHVDG